MDIATPFEYTVKCYPYMGRDETFDANLGLRKYVVANLAGPIKDGPNYHTLMDNFFASVPSLERLTAKKIADVEAVRGNCAECVQLKFMKEMKKFNGDCRNVVIEENARKSL